MQAIATTTDLVKNNTFSDSANNHLMPIRGAMTLVRRLISPTKNREAL